MATTQATAQTTAQTTVTPLHRAMSVSRRSEVFNGLIPIVAFEANGQIEAFAMRLANALLTISEDAADAKTANISFNAANLLKKNGYAFFYLASTLMEEAILKAVQAAEHLTPAEHVKSLDVLSLVSYTEMDDKLLLEKISKAIETKHVELLMSVGIRLALLLERPEITTAQNPFRADVFVSALIEAWRQFDPDTASHAMVLPLLTPEIFLDMEPIYKAINKEMIARGVMPDLTEKYVIKKSNAATATAALSDNLKNYFSEPDAAGGNISHAAAASNQLLGFLAGMQKNGFDQHQFGAFNTEQLSTALLAGIKSRAPEGSLSKVDENTIDLLTKVFDVVFHDQHIPTDIKSLIGGLQVPVLKASLIDRNFFYEDEHPARRLIDLLTKSSLSLDQAKGKDDPLYQNMMRNVKRVQQDFDKQISVFAEVVHDLETFIQIQETASVEALTTPIAQAMRQEKTVRATKAAKTDVALRVGTGEVVGFIETFLENKWISVLTIAHTVQEEKPLALESAVKTMDDLIWSVKPKITAEERKELVAKLPGLIVSLNKWLDVVKLDDADRLQFFAELAECHASIVRAPIEMSPERRLQIAMDVAKKAAERRIELRDKLAPEPEPDEFVTTVEELERGMWFEFQAKEGAAAKKVKLAWISPMRSLYIFATQDKKESFSMPAEELAAVFRDSGVRQVMLDGVVHRALTQAFESTGANDPDISIQSAA